MRYQNPQVLLALLAIVIPIIIHLFNFRKYKTIYFSSNRFIKKIKENQNKNKRLKDLLILLSRISAITFLVLGFANPYIPKKGTENIKKDILIYIDNSLSMDATGEQGRLIDVAKEIARNIIDSYTTENNFYIINNNLEPEYNQSFNNTETNKLIDNIESTSISMKISKIINYINSMLKNKSDIYIISDLQESTFSLKEIFLDSLMSYYFIPIKGYQVNNISIDSLWLNSPLYTSNMPIELAVKVTNHSENERKNIPMRIKLNGTQKSQQLIFLSKNESKEIYFKFYPEKEKMNSGIITLEDGSTSFDNKKFFSFKSASRTKILLIGDQGANKEKEFEVLFNQDSSLYKFQKASIQHLKYEILEDQDFIIINNLQKPPLAFQKEINQFIKEGGTVTIFPPSNIKFNIYNTWLKDLAVDQYSKVDTQTYVIDKINQKHTLFSNVFDGKINNNNMPKILQHYSLINTNKQIKRTLYKLENNAEYLNEYKIKSGKLYLFNSALENEYSFFSKHALFVPTLINMATQSIQTKQIYYTISNNNELTLPKNISNNSILHLKSENIDIIPLLRTQGGEKKLLIRNEVLEANNYFLFDNNKKLQPISFNYNNLESSNKYITISQIQEWKNKNDYTNCNIFNNQDNNNYRTIIKSNLNTEYWRACLILCVLSILFEILLIKLSKS